MTASDTEGDPPAEKSPLFQDNYAHNADSALHVDDGFLVAARHIIVSYGVACLEVCGGGGMGLVSSSSSSARRGRLAGGRGRAPEGHVSSSGADDRALGHSARPGWA